MATNTASSRSTTLNVSSRISLLDHFLGSDPGLNRLRAALQTVLTIGVTLITELIFVHLTQAMQINTHGLTGEAAAQATVVNHEFTIIGMLLGAIIGMISSFAVNDATASGQLVTMLFLPVVMIPALLLGLGIGGYRIPALASFAVVLAAGTYLRRFGPRGFVAGMLLFMGDFFGFFMHGAVPFGDAGWLIAEIGVGVLTAIVIRFVFFYPRPTKALARTQRSYSARARKVVRLALDLFDDPAHSDHDARRLKHQLVRLNEAALMIDAQLGDPNAVAEGSSAQRLHQRLFDVELALTNIARFAQAMAHLKLPDAQREAARQALLEITSRDAPAAKRHARALIDLLDHTTASSPEADRVAIIIPHRFAGSVIELADGMTDWLQLGTSAGAGGEFVPSVTLFGGWLPGSSQVSGNASREAIGPRTGHVGLEPYTRTAIQMGVAVGLAIIIGDQLSGRRFYWAVIAAFVTFMGVNNSGEQIRKALYRVLGTIIGIGAGSLLVSVIGSHTNWSLAVILISLFFGIYLMRISYVFMVIGITVMVSQLYVQLGEFSNSLLLLRLEETALGAVIAVAVVIFVLPLRTRHVLDVALREYLQALQHLTDQATKRLLKKGPGDDARLRAAARDVDASYQALVFTSRPIRRSLTGSLDEDISRLIRLSTASRHYARNLVIDSDTTASLDTKSRTDVESAARVLHGSLETLSKPVAEARSLVYARSAALFDRTERRLEAQAGKVNKAQLAIRDLKLLDGTLAELAESRGYQIVDHDTQTKLG